jgi:hypothetical protein
MNNSLDSPRGITTDEIIAQGPPPVRPPRDEPDLSAEEALEKWKGFVKPAARDT